MSGYKVVRLEEIEEVDDGREPFRPVRHHLGISSFGVNSWTGRRPGDRIINEHDESDPEANEELYVVMTGRASFELDGEQVEAPTGTLVFVRPGVKRTAIALEGNTTLLAIGGTPGRPYRADGWELWAPLNRLFEAGQHSEVAERGRELLHDDPPYAALYYNVACAESLAGQRAQALQHLRRALELGAYLRELAREDPDLEALRAEPEFAQLVGDP